jgi:hypothetical protein
MRFLMYLAVFIGFLPQIAVAQVYYNAPSNSSATLYNAPDSSYGYGSAPLNLKAIVRGSEVKSSGKTGYTYKGKPYGIDRSSYSLALSPEQARLNSIKRDRAIADRQREKEMQQARAEAEYEKKLKEFYSEDKSNNYEQSRSSQSRERLYGNQARQTSNATQRKRVLYYNKRNSKDPIVPKRVFNTPY